MLILVIKKATAVSTLSKLAVASYYDGSKCWLLLLTDKPKTKNETLR